MKRFEERAVVQLQRMFEHERERAGAPWLVEPVHEAFAQRFVMAAFGRHGDQLSIQKLELGGGRDKPRAHPEEDIFGGVLTRRCRHTVSEGGCDGCTLARLNAGLNLYRGRPQPLLKPVHA